MLTVILDMKNHQINCQTGNIDDIEFVQSILQKVYLKFSDEQAPLKALAWRSTAHKI